MAIDTSREAVEQINEELSWDNSFGAIELINALLAERDAALALHNAVLPGIMWVRSPNGQFCLFDHNAEEVSYSFEKDKNPARAWSLAILRAKEAGK